MRNCFESLLVKWPIVTRADLFWPISFHVKSTFGHKSLKWAWVAFQKKWGMLNAADRPYSRRGDHKDRLLSIRSVVVDSSQPNCRKIFRLVISFTFQHCEGRKRVLRQGCKGREDKGSASPSSCLWGWSGTGAGLSEERGVFKFISLPSAFGVLETFLYRFGQNIGVWLKLIYKCLSSWSRTGAWLSEKENTP